METNDGLVRGAAIDRGPRLLYVADTFKGLTIVDFQDPVGSLDRDGDQVDDRILANVPLPTGSSTAAARDVALDFDLASCGVNPPRSTCGHHIAYVSAGVDGLWAIDVGQGRAAIKLIGKVLQDLKVDDKIYDRLTTAEIT